MSISSYIDVSLMNTHLERLAVDFRVKPLADGAKFYWFCAVDDLYAMKVKRSFVDRLQDNLIDDLDDPRGLCGLFNDFEKNVESSFTTFPHLGFIGKRLC